MADEADSKSVGGNTVWVQVPLPALNVIRKTLKNQGFADFLFHKKCVRGQKGGKLKKSTMLRGQKL